MAIVNLPSSNFSILLSPFKTSISYKLINLTSLTFLLSLYASVTFSVPFLISSSVFSVTFKLKSFLIASSLSKITFSSLVSNTLFSTTAYVLPFLFYIFISNKFCNICIKCSTSYCNINFSPCCSRISLSIIYI